MNQRLPVLPSLPHADRDAAPAPDPRRADPAAVAPGRRGYAVALGLLQMLPAVLSLVVLAAHYLRSGRLGPVAGCLAALGLLAIRRRWAAQALTGLLLLGAAEWIHTAGALLRMRTAMGAPWMRMALILGAVAAVTAGAGLLLHRRTLKRWFRETAVPAGPSTAAFLLTFGLLAVLQLKVGSMLLAGRFLPGAGWVEALALSVWAAFVAERLLDPRRTSKTRRWIWGLFSLVFFAQLVLGLAGLERMLMTGELHLPVPALIVAGPIFRGAGLFMPILFGVTVLLVGPAWCSHLCYIGAWDSALAFWSKRPKPMPRWREAARWGLLATVVLAALALRLLGAPVSVAAGLAVFFGLAGVGVMVFWSRRAGVMTHCTTWCPVGLVATRLGRLSPFRMRIADHCTDCGACTLACRYDALSREDVRRRRPGSACTLCGDCVGKCRTGCIEYRLPGLKAQAARGAFIALVAALHAVFLGVARI